MATASSFSAPEPFTADSPDSAFYLSADPFFARHSGLGLTFDDVSLATLYSEILPREAQLETSLAATPSGELRLNIPVISSDMDTVTESRMAIAMALGGGLGLIHYNMTPAEQLSKVGRVKNHIHGLNQAPIIARPGQSIGDLLELIEAKGYAFSTFPVVDEARHLLGMLPGPIVKPRYAARVVADVMTPRAELHTVQKCDLHPDPIACADRFFDEHIGIHKLLVVDEEDRLYGLFTLSDIERITQERRALLKPARDARFRLLCGAAIAAKRLEDGSLDRTHILSHVGGLVERGVDVVAVSTAHGHTKGVGESVRLVRDAFPDLPIIAGNVTSGAGVEYLAECGANAIKVGQGPGSICTTRIVAGVGIPQLTALYVASRAAAKAGVRIIADGGLTKSGDLVKALTLADAVICGSLLAGCPEAPGQIMEINGKLYKQYRGMGSLAAMKAGSAARYGHSVKDTTRKVAAEGVEAVKEVSASVDVVLTQLVGGVQSGMGYLGAQTLPELREKARYIRVSPAGQKESAPHDVIEVKTGGGEESRG